MASGAKDLVTPFLTIWVLPRATIRRIVDTDPSQFVLVLAGTSYVLVSFLTRRLLQIFPPTNFPPSRYFAAGLYMQWLLTLSNLSATLRSPGAEIAIFALLGLLVGIGLLYFSGLILKWTGLLFGGTATAIEVRAAFAWAHIPFIFAVMCWSLSIGTDSGIRANPTGVLLFIGYFVFFIWWYVTLIKCVSEVHHMSAWRGLGAVILWMYASALTPLLLLLIVSSAHGWA